MKAIMCIIKRKIFASALKIYHSIMVKNALLVTYHNTGIMTTINVSGVLKTQSIIPNWKNASHALKIHQLMINRRWNALPVLKNIYLTQRKANVLVLISIVHPIRFIITIKRYVNVQKLLHSLTVLNAFLATFLNTGTITLWIVNFAHRIQSTIQA